MPKIYFCGLTSSKLVRGDESVGNTSTLSAITEPTQIKHENVTDVEIGWDYLLVWKNDKLYVSGQSRSQDTAAGLCPLEIPGHPKVALKQAIAGSEHVTLLTNSCDLWVHKMQSNTWKVVPDFISCSDEGGRKEHVIKVVQGRCTVALTNAGHVFNIPVMLNNPETVEFVDIACGFDHTILLAKNGDVYSIGMGTRGQLGHGDLEDCDEPKLIEALAGLKVLQITASGWHSAVVTDQGDLYTWGWNNRGQLGLPDVENVTAVPTLVDFKSQTGQSIEINIKKVQCGNAFTICRTDNGDFWGCGSNKYGQLGLTKNDSSSTKQFVRLKFNNVNGQIQDFKCREWGTCIYAVN
ncbi:ultraviolet-B receptor UVR8 [Copidosoma floridanum]|uniref:ultraviolet-B receptor UVR8 n=1 Tax=Copidosoma floridanum TaxID=29053 RepID=UPI000C6F4CD4|nr:ultraviolet-B receptor UVR8 [Copidosoma floridanum]